MALPPGAVLRDNGAMTQKSFHVGTAVLGGVFAVTLLLAGRPACAQGSLPGINNGVPTGPVVRSAPAAPPGRAAPSALPGARPGAAVVTPLDRPPSEMGPNEALFDAINRGDVAAARDALGRGAEVNARNVLGMTPTELSIDLGRNDITFLLLSAGGRSGGEAPPPAKAVKAVGKVHPAAPAPHRQAERVRVPVVRQAPAQRQEMHYADVPATPAPQAGFLGFGGAPRH